MPLVRLLRPSSTELARVDTLLMEAYESPSRRGELELYLRLQPDGWFVVEDAGEIVAVGGCVSYGPLAWLGLVATARRARGRGLATLVSRHLLDWAAAKGCRTVALDASALGRPVYERLGFRALGETVELVAGERLAGASPDAGTAGGQASVDELCALDRRVFGADRARVLELLVGIERLPCLTTRAADGSLSGFLVVRGEAVGPGAALGSDDARSLVARAFSERRGGARLLVPMESAHLGSLRALGMAERRRLTHMRHGLQQLPGERTRLLAQLSFAAG